MFSNPVKSLIEPVWRRLVRCADLRGRWGRRGYITDRRPHLPSSCAAI